MKVYVNKRQLCSCAPPPSILTPHPPYSPTFVLMRAIFVLFQTFLQPTYLLLLIHLDLMAVKYIMGFFLYRMLGERFKHTLHY